MKREIKFRAWDYEGKSMIYPSKFPDNHHHSFTINGGSLSYYNLQNGFGTDIIMQFTGLKDKKGKECYENDIYKNGENGLIGLMVYVDSLGGYLLYADEKKEGKQYTYRPFHEMDNTDIEVIGNIHENPELLK